MNWTKIKLKLRHLFDKATGFDEQNVIPWPPITEDMKRRHFTWAQTLDGEFIMVCDFCGGNCGQCGNTDTLGNIPFSMDRMIEGLTRAKPK